MFKQEFSGVMLRKIERNPGSKEVPVTFGSFLSQAFNPGQKQTRKPPLTGGDHQNISWRYGMVARIRSNVVQK